MSEKYFFLSLARTKQSEKVGKEKKIEFNLIDVSAAHITSPPDWQKRGIVSYHKGKNSKHSGFLLAVHDAGIILRAGPPQSNLELFFPRIINLSILFSFDAIFVSKLWNSETVYEGVFH